MVLGRSAHGIEDIDNFSNGRRKQLCSNASRVWYVSLDTLCATLSKIRGLVLKVREDCITLEKVRVGVGPRRSIL